MKSNAAANNYKIKVFLTVKTCSSFLNYVSSTSLDIAMKVSSSERRRVVLLMESIQISPYAFYLRTRGELMLANFGMKIQPF